jgi:ATP-dependent RNA helicase SUPV3L1/SUV3
MSAFDDRRRVTAVLGPTNTGKTYFAIERMLDHDNGMIGFPLRLLARENYDRVIKLKGARHVALVTGEEKIVPPTARYFLCTAESMPLERAVEFLAIDEVQMCADPERGHVFTDRLLRARGTVETMFLGADTMRGLIRRLVPETEFVARPRLSKLSYAGPKKLTRLPARSAVVAFSANHVYEIAELIRRQRGGTAVVLGALSPRTRNAQVAMYQAGEVDYLVATDAIGMGLNMNVDHVAFSAIKKFDGRVHRRLATPELAQIAGRAGRYMNDGTFGTVAEIGPLEEEVVEAIENHTFKAVPALQWRNPDLDFRSTKSLMVSLERRPDRPELMRARDADDYLALASFTRDPDVQALARHREAVRTLWEVCQIPDFRKTMAEAHSSLLKRIFRYLMAPSGRLPTDWVADQIARLDRPDGDIDTLMARIAHVRTWTYVSHRADWLDGLSDALHQRLTQRFVDRRAAALSRARVKDSLFAAVETDGSIVVEGEFVGRIEGFQFIPDGGADGSHRALLAAANRVMRDEIARRVTRLEADDDSGFALDDRATIAWRGAPVGRLVAGGQALSPSVEVVSGDALVAEQRERVRARLADWLRRHLEDGLEALFTLQSADLSGPPRGLAFQLVEALGSLPRAAARTVLKEITADDRKSLARFGVRFGIETVYISSLIKPQAARLRALLWSVNQGAPCRLPPAPGLASAAIEDGVGSEFYEACGYRVMAGRAIRVDVLDKLAIRLRRAGKNGPFAMTPEMINPAGLTTTDAVAVFSELGYAAEGDDDSRQFVRRVRKRPRGKAPAKGAAGRRRRRDHADSPFAKLRELQTPE